MSPTKVAVAGEGGIVATTSADLAEHVRLGRDYGNPGDLRLRASRASTPGCPSCTLRSALASLQGLDERLAHRRAPGRDLLWAGVAGVPGLRRPTVGTPRRLDIQGPHPGRRPGRVRA